MHVGFIACSFHLFSVFVYRGASPTEVDTQGMTPLHYACSAGRPRNVDILLKKSKEGNINLHNNRHFSPDYRST